MGLLGPSLALLSLEETKGACQILLERKSWYLLPPSRSYTLGVTPQLFHHSTFPLALSCNPHQHTWIIGPSFPCHHTWDSSRCSTMFHNISHSVPDSGDSAHCQITICIGHKAATTAGILGQPSRMRQLGHNPNLLSSTGRKAMQLQGKIQHKHHRSRYDNARKFIRIVPLGFNPIRTYPGLTPSGTCFWVEIHIILLVITLKLL